MNEMRALHPGAAKGEKTSERDPLFGFPYDFDRFRPGFLDAYVSKSKRLARTAPAVQGLLQAASLPLLSRAPRPLGFLGTRFKDLIDDLISAGAWQELVVLGTAGDLRYALNRRLPFRPVQYVHRDAYRLWQQDPGLESALAARLIQRTVKAIRQCCNGWLVVENDSLFRQRFMLRCAREAGVRSLCIQDGLFQRDTPPATWHGHYADRMAVWGERTVEQFVAAGWSRDRLAVLGYPHAMRPSPAPTLPPRRVCILGQDWGNYDPALERLKRRLFDQTASRLTAAGLTLGYKPHPKEPAGAYLPDGAERVDGTLAERLDDFDAWISLSSTALLDASLAGRIAVQIHHADFHADRFDDIGYAWRLDHRQLEALPAFLASRPGAFAVPDAVIYRTGSPATRFRDLLEAMG